MLHVQQPPLLRMKCAGLAVAALLLAGANAQGAEPQSANSACFELIPARPRIEPPAAMLVDKCSGRTWLLTRSRGAYRWATIDMDSEKPKANDRPALDNQPAAQVDRKPGDPQKCFTFNNRKFCE